MTWTNGDRPSIKINLPTLGALSAIAGVVIFLGGWIAGYLTFKSEMLILNQNLAGLQGQMNTLNTGVTSDRQSVMNRLTNLEAEAKYISQGVAELKLAVVPKR